MRALLLALVVAFAAAAACTSGSTTPTPGTDAGSGAAPDAGPAAQSDAGADAGVAAGVDAGADAGPGLDGGMDLDGGVALSPEKPECVNHQGTEDCWGEWLKEVGQVTFTPVQRGQLGAGPWPTQQVVTLGAAEGLTPPILYAGTDTAQNQYAVSSGSLFVRRAGAGSFERYDRNTNGLRDYALLSVAGAGPGVAYVGLEGVFGTGDVDQDPPEIRKSGDMMRIELQPGGGISAVGYDTHNSNTPLSGKYDHSRSIFELFVPRRGPAAGEVYLGTEHGVVRYQGQFYADHRHIATDVANGNGTTSQRFGGTHAMTVTDDGTVWYGNDFRFGGLAWTPRLAEWYFDGKWLFPSYAYGGIDDRDYYEGIAVDSKGGVWAGARTFGVAHLTVVGHNAQIETLSVPDANIRDLVVDLDDTVWLATDSGLYRADATGKSWQKSTFVNGGVFDLFLDDTVTPRALYVSGRNGLVVYRGP